MPDNGQPDFYGDLSEIYHLLFADWPAAAARQGEILARFIQSQYKSGTLDILDCACGIGTQAIGLARQGHRVTATDLNAAAVARAAREAGRLGISLDTAVADFCDLPVVHPQGYQVVLACDNAVPHLMEREQVRAAALSMAGVLAPGGLLLLSTRDYDQILDLRPPGTTPRRIKGPGGHRVVFQVWDWDDLSEKYTLELFILVKRRNGWEPRSFQSRYRAWRKRDLSRIFEEAGFAQVSWHSPDSTGYYQPILTARKIS